MAPGPGSDYLHAPLPAEQAANVVRLQATSASGPSAHALTRSMSGRPMAGVTVMWRAARSLWSLACC
jgi:hypothetical protein